MNTVYLILWLAKEVNGDFVSSMVEYVTSDRTKAERFFTLHQKQEQVMNIDGHMCDIRRTIIPAELETEYKPQ